MRLIYTGQAIVFAVTVFLLTGFQATPSDAASAKSVLNSRCSTCHERMSGGGLNRIKDMRKTPEGWDMNIQRMSIWHGLEISQDERRTLVKYLSDTQGLAPSETADYRYILERRPGTIDVTPDPHLTEMCARCHTYGRFALQRRDEREWVKLIHTHVGQYPTIEYQAMARDREWWKIVTTETPAILAKNYPMNTAAWDNWKSRKAPDMSGSWRVVGRTAGKGDYQGSMIVSSKGNDAYNVNYNLVYTSGEKFKGRGAAILYTGYEWRTSLTMDGADVNEIATVSTDGNTISGRWFESEHDEIGGDFSAARQSASVAKILTVTPPFIKAGETANLSISGVGLTGNVSLGSGIKVAEVISNSADRIVVKAMADGGASVGTRSITVGKAYASSMLTVYNSIDSVAVEPPYTIARVGDGGGPLAPVEAQFEAVAMANGVDGKAGTDDDIRIGVMPASWSVAPFGGPEGVAAMMDDVSFAGKMGASGLFTPAAAGPNAKRPYGTNNVGDLEVIANVGGVTGSGHLIVTVQRWVDPPIR